MANPQPNAPTPQTPPPERSRPVLVAIITTVGVVLAGAFTALGAYINHATSSPSSVTTTPSTSSSSRHPVQSTVPTLDFVPASSGTVPWCNTFYIKASNQLPAGYKILIFDASADQRFQVTSNYGYDKSATPVKDNPNEWVTEHVYVGSEYKQDANGNNILFKGKPVSNAGYTVVVFAVLVPDSVGQLLDNVRPTNVQLIQPPPGVIANAQFDATRNGNAGCGIKQK